MEELLKRRAEIEADIASLKRGDEGQMVLSANTIENLSTGVQRIEQLQIMRRQALFHVNDEIEEWQRVSGYK